jgi:SecD/SecF fusion protein
MRKLGWPTLLVLAVFVYLFIVLALPLTRGKSPLPFGLDISGGVIVSYRPEFSSRLEGYKDLSRSELLALCKETLVSRLQRKLHSIPEVLVRSDDRIVVSIPSVTDSREVLDLVGRTYHLTMRLVRGRYGDRVANRQLFAYQGAYVELEKPEISGEMLDERKIRVIQGDAEGLKPEDRAPKVAFGFKPPYDKQFEEFTRKNIGRQVAILLDDNVEWLGTIQSAIQGTAEMSGNYSQDEAKNDEIMLKSGTLPVALTVESLSIVGPSLGQEIKDRGTMAMLLSILLILVLIALAYLHRGWFLITGIISLFTLIFLVAGFAASFKATLDLAGIAGINLSLGMGIDASIIIFEALESKLKRFKPQEIADYGHKIIQQIYSFPQQGKVLFHSNVAILLTTMLLFTADRLKSFALFMLIGIAASVGTLLITREVLQRTAGLVPGSGPSPLGWLRRLRPHLYSFRKPYYLALAAFLGITLLVGWRRHPDGGLLELGSDFRAGTQAVVAVSNRSSLQAIRQQVAARFPGAGVRYQAIGNPGDLRYLVTLDIPLELPTAEPERLAAPRPASAPARDLPGFGEAAPPAPSTNSPLAPATPRAKEVGARARLTPQGFSDLVRVAGANALSVVSIDSKISSQRLFSSMSILLLSFVLLSFYFIVLEGPITQSLSGDQGNLDLPPKARFWVPIGIILSLVHDLAIVLAVCVLLRIEISLAVVAAILTIVGYSVNDSVVLWSYIQLRLRALWEQGKAVSPVEVVTTSSDAILSRVILTSVATMIPAITIIAMDLAPLRDFAIVMMVGTLAGTTSSIYVVGLFAASTLSPRAAPRNRLAEVAPARAAMPKLTSAELKERLREE